MADYTLAEIAARLARHDDVEDEHHAQFEKGLRNLVQRHFLPPTTQQGRIFLYDRAAAATIRLAQIASEFGIPRASIDTLTRWLSGSGERREKLPSGGQMGVSHAAEAIQRVEAGEEFALHIIMTTERTVFVRADWKSDREIDPESQARADNALRLIGKGPKPEIARFSLPASELIAEILPLFAKG
ncbi:hypothetical protein [Paracoccus jeotgali]|uniref:MerR family transcriptional regulator n=1 Tax=Paracoccus jeotgali TaxID=2065379 RepID=A0A2K9MEJ1_9RHOB|nr:hypothetical protein [Paracoccus jeotgali]AUM72925.1 hypothetical protein CYR75_00135 [Paracoccus jeotgali]